MQTAKTEQKLLQGFDKVSVQRNNSIYHNKETNEYMKVMKNANQECLAVHKEILETQCLAVHQEIIKRKLEYIVKIKEIDIDKQGQTYIKMKGGICNLEEFVMNNPDKLEELEFFKLKLQLFGQMLKGVKQLHDIGIIHADLKLSNFVVFNIDNEYVLKLIDFDYSFRKFHQTIQNNGTEGYKAPELSRFQDIPQQNYELVDIWALGICFFKLFVRNDYNNFTELTQNQIQEKFIDGLNIFYSKRLLKIVYDKIVDLIKKILMHDPYKRISIYQIEQELLIIQQGENFFHQLEYVDSQKKNFISQKSLTNILEYIILIRDKFTFDKRQPQLLDQVFKIDLLEQNYQNNLEKFIHQVMIFYMANANLSKFEFRDLLIHLLNIDSGADSKQVFMDKLLQLYNISKGAFDNKTNIKYYYAYPIDPNIMHIPKGFLRENNTIQQNFVQDLNIIKYQCNKIHIVEFDPQKISGKIDLFKVFKALYLASQQLYMVGLKFSLNLSLKDYIIQYKKDESDASFEYACYQRYIKKSQNVDKSIILKNIYDFLEKELSSNSYSKDLKILSENQSRFSKCLQLIENQLSIQYNLECETHNSEQFDDSNALPNIVAPIPGQTLTTIQEQQQVIKQTTSIKDLKQEAAQSNQQLIIHDNAATKLTQSIASKEQEEVIQTISNLPSKSQQTQNVQHAPTSLPSQSFFQQRQTQNDGLISQLQSQSQSEKRESDQKASKFQDQEQSRNKAEILQLDYTKLEDLHGAMTFIIKRSAELFLNKQTLREYKIRKVLIDGQIEYQLEPGFKTIDASNTQVEIIINDILTYWRPQVDKLEGEDQIRLRRIFYEAQYDNFESNLEQSSKQQLLTAPPVLHMFISQAKVLAEPIKIIYNEVLEAMKVQFLAAQALFEHYQYGFTQYGNVVKYQQNGQYIYACQFENLAYIPRKQPAEILQEWLTYWQTEIQFLNKEDQSQVNKIFSRKFKDSQALIQSIESELPRSQQQIVQDIPQVLRQFLNDDQQQIIYLDRILFQSDLKLPQNRRLDFLYQGCDQQQFLSRCCNRGPTLMFFHITSKQQSQEYPYKNHIIGIFMPMSYSFESGEQTGEFVDDVQGASFIVSLTKQKLFRLATGKNQELLYCGSGDEDQLQILFAQDLMIDFPREGYPAINEYRLEAFLPFGESNDDGKIQILDEDAPARELYIKDIIVFGFN